MKTDRELLELAARAMENAARLLKELKVEADEDSAAGACFIKGRLSEDWFYEVLFGLEKAAAAIGEGMK